MISEISYGKYYLYRHIRLDTNEVFYIGIGTIIPFVKKFESVYKRAHSKNDRNNHWKNIVNKTDYKVEIICSSNDRNFIVKKETEFIEFYKIQKDGGSLTNIAKVDKNERVCYKQYDVYNNNQLIQENVSINDLVDYFNIHRVILEKCCRHKILVKEEYYICYHKSIIDFSEFRNSKTNRKILQFTKNGEFIKEWNNTKEAAEQLKLCYRNILYCLSGRSKTYKKFKFRYKNE